MGYFDELVEAAKSKDIRTIEQINCGDVVSHINLHKKMLELTPAGMLAQQEAWDAVELLWKQYGANTDGILFGLVLGGQLDKVLSNVQLGRSGSEDILALICKSHYEKYERSEGESYLNPIIKALEIMGDSKIVNSLLAQFKLEERFQKGMLSAAVEGAAFVGNSERVFEILGSLKDRPLQADEGIHLAKKMQVIEKKALRAAAQGGDNKLVESILRWCEEKIRIRNRLTPDSGNQSKHFDELILTALDGAASNGNIDLVLHLLSRYHEFHKFDVVFDKIPQQLIVAACQSRQFEVLQRLISTFPDERNTIQMVIFNFDQTGNTAHTSELFSWLHTSGLMPSDKQQMTKLLSSSYPGPFRFANRQQDIVNFVFGIKDHSLRALVREAIKSGFGSQDYDFQSAETEATKKALANVGRIEALQKRYCFLIGHAKRLIENPRLIQSIKENQLDEQLEKQLAATYGSHCVNLMMDWIKVHQPRAQFIDKLEQYLREYEDSWKLYRNHYDRAKSLLNVIKYDTSDEAFAQLIDQQVELLNDRPAKVVLGESADKHNQQTPNRMLHSDKFTQAVYECQKQLKAVNEQLLKEEVKGAKAQTSSSLIC